MPEDGTVHEGTSDGSSCMHKQSREIDTRRPSRGCPLTDLSTQTEVSFEPYLFPNMPSRRRLSGKVVPNENTPVDPNAEADDSRSRSSRRASLKKLRQRSRSRGRSSGNLRPGHEGALTDGGDTAASGLAVEEIRRSTMQAASQNKINAKTATFYYRFIDKIDEIINVINTDEDGVEQGTKFEECGFAVETSAQIYAAKVDETYAATGRFVADLNRNSNDADEDGSGDEGSDEEGNDSADATQNSRRKKKGGASTLDKISNIITTKLDTEIHVDPIFSKMSQNMDQGGARGMLLGKLNVENGMNIVFDTTAVMENKFTYNDVDGNEVDMEEDSTVNIDDFLTQLNAEHPNWRTMRLCPSMDLFYDSMERSARIIKNAENGTSDDTPAALPSVIDVDALNAGDDMPDEDFGSFSPQPMQTEGYLAAPFTPSQERRVNGEDFDVILDPSNVQITSDGYIEAVDQEKIDNILSSCPYWKCFAPRVAPMKGAAEVATKTRKKEKVQIDFSNTVIDIENDPDFYIIPKDKKVGKIGKSALEKLHENSHVNLLPEDVHYKPETLRSLFLTDRTKFGISRNKQAQPTDVGMEDGAEDQFDPADFDVVEDLGFDSTVTMKGYTGMTSLNDVEIPPSPSNLVSYAKKATKFDIKDLKQNMWTYIDKDAAMATEQDKFEDGFKDENEAADEELSQASSNETASFSQAFSQNHQENSEVSVPMMFLTMLFLANENSLALHPEADMSDIKIFKKFDASP
jgi:condensin complex subunit 2